MKHMTSHLCAIGTAFLLTAGCGAFVPRLNIPSTPRVTVTDEEVAVLPTATPEATATFEAPTTTPTLPPTPTATTRPKPTATPQPAETPEPVVITSTLDNGWVRYEMADDGIAIALPPTWEQLVLDPESWDAALDAVAEDNEGFAAMLKGQAKSLIAAGIKFYALDVSEESAQTGSLTTVNIIKAPFKIQMSLKAFIQVSVSQMKTLENIIEPVKQRTLNISGYEAGELSYSIKMSLVGQKPTTVPVLQYIMLVDNTAYIISFVTTSSEAKKQVSVFQKIMNTFEPQLLQ